MHNQGACADDLSLFEIFLALILFYYTGARRLHRVLFFSISSDAYLCSNISLVVNGLKTWREMFLMLFVEKFKKYIYSKSQAHWSMKHDKEFWAHSSLFVNQRFIAFQSNSKISPKYFDLQNPRWFMTYHRFFNFKRNDILSSLFGCCEIILNFYRIVIILTLKLLYIVTFKYLNNILFINEKYGYCWKN